MQIHEHIDLFPDSPLVPDDEPVAQTDAVKASPSPSMPLADFVHALERYHDPDRKHPYYRLPAREAVYFMLTGKGDKEAMRWREIRGPSLDYRLILFNEEEKPAAIDAEALKDGATVPDNLAVRLDNVALLFWQKLNGGGSIFLSVPWQSVDGKPMSVYDAQDYIGDEHVSYVGYSVAEGILLRRFKDTSREEISLWLRKGEIPVWWDKYISAPRFDYDKHFTNSEMFYSISARKLPTLAELLDACFFSRQQLEAFKPKVRWRSYEYLLVVGERWRMDKERMDDLIRRYWNHTAICAFQIHPSPKAWQDDEVLNQMVEDIQSRLYPSDWIDSIVREELEPRHIELTKADEDARVSAEETERAENMGREKDVDMASAIEKPTRDKELELNMRDVLSLFNLSNPEAFAKAGSQCYEIDERGIKGQPLTDDLVGELRRLEGHSKDHEVEELLTYWHQSQKENDGYRLEFPCTSWRLFKWCKEWDLIGARWIELLPGDFIESMKKLEAKVNESNNIKLINSCSDFLLFSFESTLRNRSASDNVEAVERRVLENIANHLKRIHKDDSGLSAVMFFEDYLSESIAEHTRNNDHIRKEIYENALAGLMKMAKEDRGSGIFLDAWRGKRKEADRTQTIETFKAGSVQADKIQGEKARASRHANRQNPNMKPSPGAQEEAKGERIVNKATLIKTLKPLVEDGTNLEGLFSNASKIPALAACKSPNGRGWKWHSFLNFLANKGYLKAENMQHLVKAGLEQL